MKKLVKFGFFVIVIFRLFDDFELKEGFGVFHGELPQRM